MPPRLKHRKVTVSSKVIKLSGFCTVSTLPRRPRCFASYATRY